MSNSTAGRLPGYETIVISRTELTDDQVNAMKDKLNSILPAFGGTMVHTEDWGKRKMAYSIQKESRGHYHYFVYTGKGAVVHEFERNLRLNEGVLRFLTVHLGAEFDGEEFVKNAANHKREFNPADKGYGSYRDDYRKDDYGRREDYR